MLITFKSAASADVLMFEEAAKVLLAVIGKEDELSKGIVTVEQLPQAIARLQEAMAQDHRHHEPLSEEQEAADREAGHTGMAASVTFSQRAWPLLDMLEQAQRAAVPVVWGV